MATTDTKPGFRLPWSTNGADAEANGSEPAEAAQATDAEAVAEPVTDDACDRGPHRRRGACHDRRDRSPAEAVAEVAAEPEPEPAMAPDPEPVAAAAPARRRPRRSRPSSWPT